MNLPAFGIWMVILIPLSVDNLLNVPVGHYDLRLSYGGAAAALVLLCFKGSFRSDGRLPIESWLRSSHNVAFSVMALAGLAGALGSTHFTRSALFLMWSTATLVLVPYVVRFMWQELRDWLPRCLLLYLGLQVMLIFLDAAICIPSGGEHHLGRVMVYVSREVVMMESPFRTVFVQDHDFGPNLCRPQALYQEPAFFSAFALLAAILGRAWSRRDPSRLWRKMSHGVYLSTFPAMALTFSRTGWLAVALLLAFEGFSWARARAGQASPDTHPPRARWRAIRTASVVLSVLAIALLLRDHYGIIHYNILEELIRPKQTGSIAYRSRRLDAAIQVFRDNLWFGAGPGAAGAYYVDRMDANPAVMGFSAEEQDKVRNDPLSQNLYSELLSEWGLVGTGAYFAGLVLMFRNSPPDISYRLLPALAILYLSTQTLPRFDLWWLLGMLFELRSSPRKNLA